MNDNHADRRDAKRHRARHGMKVTGRGLFTIQRLEAERAAGLRPVKKGAKR